MPWLLLNSLRSQIHQPRFVFVMLRTCRVLEQIFLLILPGPQRTHYLEVNFLKFEVTGMGREPTTS